MNKIVDMKGRPLASSKKPDSKLRPRRTNSWKRKARFRNFRTKPGPLKVNWKLPAIK